MLTRHTATTILLATLLPAIPTLAEGYTEGRSKWGDEFCRTKFCAVMSTTQQNKCCDGYKQCCAYVDLRKNEDPFAWLESHEVAETPPTLSPPSPLPPSPTFSHREIYVGPPKSMRLREEDNPSRQPPSLSLTRHPHNHNHHHNHHHRHHHRPAPRPPPRPAILLLDGGKDLMKTSYNDQLVKGEERVCKTSYCSLLSPSQHKLCCNIFDTCCAYSNYRKTFDLFHPDNGKRRRR